MAAEVQDILRSFELLPEGDKVELAAEIIRRSVNLDVPPLSDEQLISAAEDLFLELDRSEAEDA